jgi:DNA-binding Lrp family transcriptional regulator
MFSPPAASGRLPTSDAGLESNMVTAIVLIKAETNRIPDLADQIANMKGVSEVFSVAGRYDLVALVRVTKNEELADVISDKMRHLEGIVETETMIAFRAYSKQELEAGFELGLD